jgi:hypothetical protein
VIGGRADDGVGSAVVEGEGLFSTIASVAISLAGFSGIVLAVGRQGATLTETERYRFAVLMWNALGATFLAVAPMVLHELDPEVALWQVSSGAMAVADATAVWVWATRSLQQMRIAPQIFNLPTFRTLLGMHVANIALQMLAGLGLVDGPGTYAVGLLVLLAHATNQFLRMLFRPLQAGAPAEQPPPG